MFTKLFLSFLLTLVSINLVEARTLEQGDRGEDVWRVKKCLRDLGLLTSANHPYFCSYMEHAVRIVESRYKGFRRDGKVTDEEQSLIVKLTREKVLGEVRYGFDIEVPKGTNFLRELKRGSQGPDVTRVQKILKNKGFYVSSTDGIFGDYTELAVRKFQIANGLRPTGEVNYKTWQKIIASGKRTVVKQQPQPERKPLRRPSSKSDQKLKEEGFRFTEVKTSRGKVKVAYREPKQKNRSSRGIISNLFSGNKKVVYSGVTNLSEFGYKDRCDSGKGAQLCDPQGRGINTDNTKLVGLALPESVLQRCVGIKPNGTYTDRHGKRRNRYSFKEGAKIWPLRATITNLENGRTVQDVKLVDIGPSEKKLRQGVGADGTYALNRLIRGNGHTKVKVEVYLGQSG